MISGGQQLTEDDLLGLSSAMLGFNPQQQGQGLDQELGQELNQQISPELLQFLMQYMGQQAMLKPKLFEGMLKNLPFK